jgi:hypothetical protein
VNFRDVLRSGNSLVYNWSIGTGLDYLGLIAYYLGSPLNLISVILPDSWVLPYFELLLPLKKSKNKEEKLKQMGVGGPLLYASPSTGLVALVETRYKFIVFGKSEHVCVYRIADLVQYDHEVETVTNSEGKPEQKHYCVMAFRNTAGLYTFRLAVSGQKGYESIAKYFDTLFGIQKTLGNTINNATRQLDAIKAAASAVKGAVDGTLNEEQAAETVATLDASIYGDRTRWIEKADAALAKFQ